MNPTHYDHMTGEELIAECERLRASNAGLAIEELKNIVNARRFDPGDFENDSEFADWAQSRARYTLAIIESAEAK